MTHVPAELFWHSPQAEIIENVTVEHVQESPPSPTGIYRHEFGLPPKTSKSTTFRRLASVSGMQ
jgi:hypothetical protein